MASDEDTTASASTEGSKDRRCVDGVVAGPGQQTHDFGVVPQSVVMDQEEACVYLPNRRARLPLRLPVRALVGDEVDASLASGDRRHGVLLYRMSCHRCSACEPLRIPVADFHPGRTHRRLLRRNDARFRVVLAEPTFSEAKLELYERHKAGRDLLTDGSTPLDDVGYRAFLVDRCVPGFELQVYRGDRLVAVSVTDVGQSAMSAVYCFFDPERPSDSLGTYAILKQLELCERLGMSYLYLGLYVEENEHMRYKGSFLPHERLIDGAWQRFSRT